MDYTPFFNRDCKFLGGRPARRGVSRRAAAAGVGLVLAAAALAALLAAPPGRASREGAPPVVERPLDLPGAAVPGGVARAAGHDGAAAVPGPARPARSREVVPPREARGAERWRTLTVRRGDSLARLLAREGIGPRTVHALVTSGPEARRLRRLRPGERILLARDAEGAVTALRYPLGLERTLEVRREGDGYRARLLHHPLERRQAHAAGVIEDSLFTAAQKAGLSDRLTMALAGIFGWDIDFALDLRPGDRFSVIYETLHRDGERVGEGEILAAEFVNRGRVHRAVRYTDPEGRTGYYTPEGRSVRRAFLRTPVAFTRISSRFRLRRRHPVLNRIRAHRGVDYAAPHGTPVKATGEGRVIFRGRKGGYGRVVMIRHGARYVTVYAHLSRFARGLRAGRHVRQGQVIGYVGATGLATGPHLHYEFRVDGVHRNPLTVRLPAARPVPARHREDFRRRTAPLVAALDTLRRVQLARRD